MVRHRGEKQDVKCPSCSASFELTWVVVVNDNCSIPDQPKRRTNPRCKMCGRFIHPIWGCPECQEEVVW